MNVRKGAPWGEPAEGDAGIVVEGDDAALARAVQTHRGERFVFRPAGTSDFARALGLSASTATPTTEVSCDAMDVEADGVASVAVNMVVFGTAPDRQRWWSRAPAVLVSIDDRVVHEGSALGVVIANGQHLRGNDVVPRGHPGDGRIEVHVYALERRERGAMRARLRDGTHVPHPRIRTASGRHVEVWAAEGIRALEIDGVRHPPVTAVTVTVAPNAFRLLL